VRKGSNEVLTLAEEADFVAHFEDAARKGQLVTATMMLTELAERCGKPPTASTLYRILARPRLAQGRATTAPPRCRPERQEAFKQTFQRCWHPPMQEIHVR
jgi:hypothetical protein